MSFDPSFWTIATCDCGTFSSKITCVILCKPETDRRFWEIQSLVLVSVDDILLVEPDRPMEEIKLSSDSVISTPSVLQNLLLFVYSS